MIDTGIILAGGRSVRLGRDKIVLDFGKETLLERAIKNMKELFSQVIVAANDRSLAASGVEIVYDEVPYLGPLGGVLSGLKASQSEFSLTRAVDMPFLNDGLVKSIIGRIDPLYDVIICQSDRGLEPLSAVYNRRLVPLLEQQVSLNQTSLIAVCEKVKTLVITKEETGVLDPGFTHFLNINDETDLNYALSKEFKESK